MELFKIKEDLAFNNLLSLKGKTAIITGGSRGLGKQTVKRFIEAGANVVFTARNEKALKDTEKELGKNCIGMKADASITADSKRVVDFTVEAFKSVDILVNNAAVFPGCTAMDMTEEIWDETFDTDTKGAFFMAKFAAKQMIAQGKGGRIINFLSTAALAPTSILSAYGAAKSALWYATKTLATELAQHKITVNAVTPGATMTPERIAALGSGDINVIKGMLGQSSGKLIENVGEDMIQRMPQIMATMMPMGRTGFPDDLAKAVLFLASDMAEYITGVNITVDGGQSLQTGMSAAMNTLKGNGDTASTQKDNDEEMSAGGVSDIRLEGKWKATAKTPAGEQEIVFDYHFNDYCELTGSVTLMGNTLEIERGRATTEGYSHIVRVKSPLGRIKVPVTGRLEDGKLIGQIKSPMGILQFEAERV
jgi:NAD(P)-dependent dehydrogenase (short-subunit alcohol dehydrogenase family)